jgi:hypothetical protein
MFGFFDYVFSYFIGFVWCRLEDILLILFPLYLTANILHKQEKKYYTNLMCYWAIIGIIYGIEYITFFIFYRYILYRIIRLLFIIYLQLNYCENASILMKQQVNPLVDPNEKIIEETFMTVSNIMNRYSESGLNMVKEKFGQSLNDYGPALWKTLNDFRSSKSTSSSIPVSSSTSPSNINAMNNNIVNNNNSMNNVNNNINNNNVNTNVKSSEDDDLQREHEE